MLRRSPDLPASRQRSDDNKIEVLMELRESIWIHQASFTYRLDEPEKIFETVWAERPGWGYIRRTDLWIVTNQSRRELLFKGYVERKPIHDHDVKLCKTCGMYMCSIPEWLANKHFSECVGGTGYQRLLEEFVLEDQRMKRLGEKIRAKELRERLEIEAAEKRERTERVRGETQARQLAKDRKKVLKQEVKDQLKDR
ncbi:MAG: hypothetical protein NTW27_07695 [Deltaproteobacteria bacterium]|nr:hypothetical protein [Deltaproteobacteria bacterium]